MRVLLVDNHDSYTYNLFQLIASTYEVEPVVITNDDPAWDELDLGRFDAVVLSPGPGRPQTAQDVGRVPELLRSCGLPVLGVCLGHQLLAWLAGADVVGAPAPRHGHLERVTHDGRGLFEGVPQQFTGVRYHSLCVAEPLPAELEATAWGADGVIMALRHRDRPWWGVQFHPESIATEHGAQLLVNFRRLVRPADASSGDRSGHVGRSVHTRCHDRAVDTGHAFTTAFAGSTHAFWLDSSRVEPGLSRWSFLGDAGGPCGEVLTAIAGAGRVDVRDGDGRATSEPGSIFDVLRDRLAGRAPAGDAAVPFDLAGGYVGYFGYEMKSECGSPNRHSASVPDAQWMTASRMIAVDHQGDRSWVMALCDGSPDSCGLADRWISTVTPAVAEAVGDPPPAPVAEKDTIAPEMWFDRSREHYLNDIAECHRSLRAGESYEICLTGEAELPFHGSPLDTYRRLRVANPAPYSAYLRLGELHLMCSSPERFLKIDTDRTVESKPIKGTAPRGADPEHDERLCHELTTSTKTRAENLMITDLVRNDLGQVCEVDSVVVPKLMHVESYATVHQLVSTIRGKLRDDVCAVDAVRACFPGGSMTGAPKERTMEIIEKLEDRARGVYSGTLGYFGFGGSADLNIVIRTAVVQGERLTIGAGGAIVIDSDAEEEYAEMLVKASASLRAVNPSDLLAP